MALLLADGFRHSSAVVGTPKWTYSSRFAITSSTPRIPGGYYTYCTDTYAVQNIQFASTYSTMWAGTAYRAGSYTSCGILSFKYGGGYQLTLVDWSLNNLAVYRGSASGTWLAAKPYALRLGEWAYIEVGATLHPSNGWVEVRVNGETIISLSGINTSGTGGTGADMFQLGSSVGNVDSGTDSAHNWTDVYCCGYAGSSNNGFLGDIKVETLVPDGAGSATQWTPSAGSNYQTVDELSSTWPNGDTDYNSSLTVGHQDLFTLGNLATTSGSVKALQYLLYARKDDAGTRGIKGLVRPSSTTSYTGPHIYLSNSYGYSRDVLETNPEDSQPWDIADVNGAQFGYELTI